MWAAGGDTLPGRSVAGALHAPVFNPSLEGSMTASPQHGYVIIEASLSGEETFALLTSPHGKLTQGQCSRPVGALLGGHKGYV